jgi:hypothetical protein
MTLAHKLKNSRPMMPVHMSQWQKDNDADNIPFGEEISNVRLRTGLICQPTTSNDSCFGCWLIDLKICRPIFLKSSNDFPSCDKIQYI